MTERARFQSRLSSVGTYCYVWLMVGFAAGTLILVGPVQWLTAAMRANGWSQGTENLAMLGVIGTYVLASALASWWLVGRMGRCRSTAARASIPAAATVAAAVCLWAWMNPTMLAQVAGGEGGHVAAGRAEFVFGPYPDRPTLESLKREGYTAVISLQHPAVLPFEPPGIAAEREAAAEIGLTFIHAPMLPWISNNSEALAKIRTIAREGAGRYYVHCGLGRDRANVVKRMLEREGERVAAAEGFMKPRTFAQRIADGKPPFERGAIAEIEPDVWLIPYPNKWELGANMLSGQVAHVFVLLDPADAQQRAWIRESTALFNEFDVPYTLRPLLAGDEAGARAVVEATARLPRPLAVIVPFTAPQPSTEVADTFLGAHRARVAE